MEKAKADGMFRGEVLGPVLLEVAISDPQHAKYLEQQMPRATISHPFMADLIPFIIYYTPVR